MLLDLKQPKHQEMRLFQRKKTQSVLPTLTWRFFFKVMHAGGNREF